VASAQDAPKVEIFGGYSYLHFDAPGVPGNEIPPILANLNGGSASIAVNPMKYLGLVADFGGYAAGESSDLGSAHLFTFLFGPKVAFRSGPFTPFAQVLLGGAHLDISGVPNTFAWAAGGGLDYNLSAHWGVRVVQVEYLGTYFNDGATNTQHNIRASAGVVYRF
jgi:opacity protein-like surface antigen